MDLKRLEYFITIVEEGNITKAAKKLHMAQPPLSTQLKLLEEELGIQLIKRGSRQIELTDAGLILYKRAKHLINYSDSILTEIDDFKMGVHGVLRLGTISSSGSFVLNTIISKYKKLYPDVTFELSEGNSYQIINKIYDGSIEVGIVRTPFELNNLNCIFLKEEPMVAIIRKDFLSNRDTDCAHLFKSHISLSDLKGLPIILYRRFQKLILSKFAEINIEPSIYCLNDDARTTLLWAKAGLGIGIIPKSAANLDDNDDIMAIEFKEDSLKTKIAVIWSKDRYLSNAAQSLINALK